MSTFTVWTDPGSELSYLCPELSSPLYSTPSDTKLINWCRKFISTDKCLVDIGAHIGRYSIHLSPHCKEVYAFEPQRLIHNALCGGLALNGITNVHTYRIALGSICSERKRVPLYVMSEDGLVTSMEEVPEGRCEMVMIYTLDSLKLKDIGLIKLSVGGSELDILRGAEETMRSSDWPTILLTSRKIKPILVYLKGLGYSLVSIAGRENMYLATHATYGCQS